jgi:hypothetical protein
MACKIIASHPWLAKYIIAFASVDSKGTYIAQELCKTKEARIYGWGSSKDRGAGAHGSQGTMELCQINGTIISYWYSMSSVTYKWFGCYGIAACLFGLALGNT